MHETQEEQKTQKCKNIVLLSYIICMYEAASNYSIKWTLVKIPQIACIFYLYSSVTLLVKRTRSNFTKLRQRITLLFIAFLHPSIQS